MGTLARGRIAERQRERQREENEWNAAHPERPGSDDFRRDVLPAIQGVSLGELARRTGLSIAYCARIRRGEEVPHPRWWTILAPVQGCQTGSAARRHVAIDDLTQPKPDQLSIEKCAGSSDWHDQVGDG